MEPNSCDFCENASGTKWQALYVHAEVLLNKFIMVVVTMAATAPTVPMFWGGWENLAGVGNVGTKLCRGDVEPEIGMLSAI
eukprot:1789575-Amphidinium_carterae.1